MRRNTVNVRMICVLLLIAAAAAGTCFGTPRDLGSTYKENNSLYQCTPFGTVAQSCESAGTWERTSKSIDSTPGWNTQYYESNLFEHIETGSYHSTDFTLTGVGGQIAGSGVFTNSIKTIDRTITTMITLDPIEKTMTFLSGLTELITDLVVNGSYDLNCLGIVDSNAPCDTSNKGVSTKIRTARNSYTLRTTDLNNNDIGTPISFDTTTALDEVITPWHQETHRNPMYSEIMSNISAPIGFAEVSATETPEPGTCLMFAAGLGTAFIARRKIRNR